MVIYLVFKIFNVFIIFHEVQGFDKDDLAGVARLRLLAEAGAPIDIKVWTLLYQWFGHRGELYHMIRDMLMMECKHRLIQYTSDWSRLRHI